ncbi:zinc finger CCCH domain-containing protein 18-like isoform X5 [Rhododendron vialii]|uniref:zinc finger CCCH domain-containing protein 18-like isoform X5 n=1 Tax=Rhododendron vialii TaxID=182163 RepID=UPI00265EB74B|nr:zinc finger CCCH domain-containing protein 18-like isoform X5 [Rhododendron vialii]
MRRVLRDLMTEKATRSRFRQIGSGRCEMDSFEASTIVFSRIRKLEPENVTNKIVGYLLLQDCRQEMIRLAFGPDHLITNLIHRIKIQLGLVSKPSVSIPMSPVPAPDLPFMRFSPVSSPTTLRLPNHYWESRVNPEPIHNPHFVPIAYSDSVPEDFRLENRSHFMRLEDQFEPFDLGNQSCARDFYNPEATFSRRHRSPTEFPIKVCHYFNKGFCKHGSNCRYFHGNPFLDSFYQMFSPRPNEFDSEDQVFSPRSLEKLEYEISELLKSRRGNPVSIASLPMLYYEKYGRTLQAEGYLTESQRHGKAGFSLTKLLARLNNSVRLIDRPHGQHSVVLAEDVPKYMENCGERNDPGQIVSGSRQIYLTFPSESTFTEEDVSNYFDSFGPVEDVRIPCQQKRMFGFVTFVSADTVRMILSRGNPHYVCGARVLVKPYREKSKLFDRKYPEKLEHQMSQNSLYFDMDSEIHPRWESSRLMREPFMDENEHGLEVQTRRLSGLQLSRRPLANQESYFGYSMDELKASEGLIYSEDHSKFSSAERFNHLLDVHCEPTSDDDPKLIRTIHTDQESQGVNLPESPFASPIVSSISTVLI